MNRKDILIGLAVIAVVAAAVYLIRRPGKTGPQIPTPTPRSITVQERIEESFNFKIPGDVERAELSDVSGGTGSGLATRKFGEGKFSHTVLADLPDPTAGSFYQGWLVRGKPEDPDFSIISTGKLRIAKGGYLLEFESRKDYSDHKSVVVTLEKKDDKKPETHILEGSF